MLGKAHRHLSGALYICHTDFPLHRIQQKGNRSIDRVGLLTVIVKIFKYDSNEDSIMNTNPRRTAAAAALFLILVALDLITKSLAVSALRGGIRIDLIKGVLEFYYIENRGAAFGIFQDGTLILGIISAVSLCVIITLYLKTPDDRKYLPLRLVFVFLSAGAAGNLIDRISLHYVRDFIYFSLIDFPVFNVADIYVTCSVFVLAYLIVFHYREEDLAFLGFKEDSRHEET